MRLLIAALALATLLPAANAQSIDATTRALVIDRTITQIREHYVDPAAGARVEAALRRDPHAFDASTDAQAFADRLTERLRSVVDDRHLHVEYSLEPIPPDPVPQPGDVEHQRARDEQANYGVERVEHLPGNIGYLDLRSFAKTAWAAETIAGAMTLVAHADALIVDLRENGGGYPATVTLVESYLFDARTHVVDVHWRAADRTEQFWTQDSVPGARFGQARPGPSGSSRLRAPSAVPSSSPTT